MRRWHRGILLILVALLNVAVLVTISTAIAVLLADENKGWGSVADSEVGMWRGDLLHDSLWWGCCGLPAIIVTITQIIFVLPLLGTRPVMASHGKPLLSSIAMAAVVAAGLCVGLLFAVAEVCGWFEPMTSWAFDGSVRNHLPPLLGDWLSAFWPWVFIGAGWLVWTPLLLTFARRRNSQTRWGRCVGLLLGGTVLETLIVVPMDIMVRRRSECYCGSGSFFSLVISMWALLWLTGPGIVIAATSKRRRLWSETQCTRCGHAKGPSPGERCPECGFDWRKPGSDATRQASAGD